MANDIVLAGFETTVGDKLMTVVDHFGPTSYTLGTGQSYTINNLNRGGFYWVDAADFSFDGAYAVSVQYPTSAVGIAPGNVILRWYYVSGTVSGVTIATPGTGQTNGTYVINSTGGGGTGAQVTVVIAGGLVTSAVVTNAGVGYTSAPTFTVPTTAGTTGTLTATAATASGVEVATATNLSTKAIRLIAFML